MKIRKILVFILFVFVLTVSGCTSESPQKLWNKYIKAMNSKEIERVAEIYYVKGSYEYDTFIEAKNPVEYFNFESIKTKSFTTLVDNNRIYVAEVEAFINGEEYYFDVYFIRDLGGPWRFISEVSLNPFNINELGNKPNDNYYNNVILNNGDFDYKYYYATKPGQTGPNDYVKIVFPNSNKKIIEIPDTIDGALVTHIGDKAFYEFGRIFSITFPKSKLEQITLPNSLKIIDEYAFYQTKNLKSINLPSSLKEVKNYAFASSGLQSIVINVDDTEAYANLKVKASTDAMSIYGNKVIYNGESETYSIAGYAYNAVSWSTSDPEIATISDTGKLTTLQTGTVDIIVTLKENSSIKATGTVQILDASEKNVNSDILESPFADFKFTTKKVHFTGEEASISIPLSANWSTSNSNIAKVEGGKIKMVGAGTVTITATSTANPNVKVSATITVKDISEKIIQTRFSYNSFSFTGARDMFVGDYIKIIAANYKESEIEWSSSDESKATIGRYNGVITAKAAGSVTIKGVQVSNPNIVTIVTIIISDPIKGPVFFENSLDRLYNLKEIYINSINPYSVEFKGTLKLPADVKIFVPAQNIDSYKKHPVLSKYVNNIFPIPNQ